MRTAERIHLVVFSFLTLLAAAKSLPRRRLAMALLLGTTGLAATVVSARLDAWLPRLASSVVRDWLPAPLMLLVYWQAGQFFVQPQESFQRRLARLDERLIASPLLAIARRRRGRWLLGYLEFAYLFCYPMIPLSVAAIYILRMGGQVDRYWTAVLPATYVCYVMVPFAQMLPPRLIEEPWTAGLPKNSVRELNLRILRSASIHANTFPSAHVAASISSALALMRLAPPVGAAFLWVALSISFGAVFGRYHYAADAILGATVALAVFAIS